MAIDRRRLWVSESRLVVLIVLLSFAALVTEVNSAAAPFTYANRTLIVAVIWPYSASDVNYIQVSAMRGEKTPVHAIHPHTATV